MANTRAPTTNTVTPVFTVEQISDHKSVTPEGFLWITDVPMARVGELIYRPGEVDLNPGPDGLIHVFRQPEQLFDRDSMLTLHGKPIVVLHPSEGLVDTDNWSRLAHGVILDPHPNEDRTILLANWLVCTEEAIQALETNLTEVSLGYYTKYVQTGVGRGEATKIIYNHGALVPTGRCGARCTVHDHAGGSVKATLLGQLRDLFKTKDERGFEDLVASGKLKALTVDEEGAGGGSETHIHVHSGSEEAAAGGNETIDDDERLDGIEKQLAEHAQVHTRIEASLSELKDLVSKLMSDDEEEEEEGGGEEESKDALENEISELDDEDKKEAKMSKDSGFLLDSYREVAGVAEIISPGIVIPTYDAAAAPSKTAISICGMRRRALQRGLTGDAAEHILKARGGRKITKDALKTMPCGKVTALFDAVGQLVASKNNAAGATHDAQDAVARARTGSTPVTTYKSTHDQLVDINKRNKDFWKDK